MDTLTQKSQAPPAISMESFLRTCFDEALSLGEEKLSIPDFSSQLVSRVASQTGYSPDSIDYLIRPTYWTLSCRNGSSLLHHCTYQTNGGVTRIEPTGDSSVSYESALSFALDRYGTYLHARASQLDDISFSD